MNRWAVLTGYSILVLSSQMLWLTFSPITIQSAAIMHTTVDLVGDLSLVFPLVYIFLALPIARWLDLNFKSAIIIGASLNGIGGLIRLVDPLSFDWQMISQIIISLGQPIILSSITIVAVRYFPIRERPLAISLSSVAIFLGIIVATAAGISLYLLAGYEFVLEIEAIPGMIGLGLIVVSLMGSEKEIKIEKSKEGPTKIFHYDRMLIKLAILLFIGMGSYDTLATWLQPIIASYGFPNSAGDIIGLMTFAGILGSVVLPQVAVSKNQRKTTVLFIMIFTIAAFASILTVHNLLWIYAWLAVDGFFLLAGLPVLLEWAEIHTGPERQGQATGLLMWAGNLGGFIMILVAQIIIAHPSFPIVELIIALVLALGLSVTLPTRYRKASESGEVEII